MTISYYELNQAWKHVRRGKSGERHEYQYDVEDRLYRLRDELEGGTFEPQPMRTKEIYHPKRRTAKVPVTDDKIVQQAICERGIYDDVARSAIKESSACLKGRGTQYASQIVKEQLAKYYRKRGKDFWVLQCDIRGYFANIDRTRMKALLDRQIRDPDVREIAKQYIDAPEGEGIPLGLAQSHYLSNLYLTDMDNMVKHRWRVKFYGRYKDDFYIVSHDRDELERYWRELERYLDGIGLELNPKTRINRNRLEFCGFYYFLTDSGKIVKRVLPKKKKQARRHMQKMVKDFAAGIITAQRLQDYYQGYRTHLTEGDCHNLILATDRRFDAMLRPLGYQLKLTTTRKGKRNRRVTICPLNCNTES